jgi:tetratricopeptide (TPR) repeat protein
MNKNEVISYIENVSLVLIALSLLTLPLFFLTNTTDIFVFPKQLLLTLVTALLLILWGIKMVAEKKITVRSNPFNLPVFLFGVITLVSSILSPNMFDSLLQSVPVLFVLFLFFIMVNTINNRNYFNIALSALALGGVLSALLSILYYLKIYVLPIPAIQNQYFNPFGSPIQQIAYFLPILVLSSIYVIRKYRKAEFKEITSDYSSMILVVSSIVLIIGILMTLFKTFTLPQKPIVLPMMTGFQVALASIAQNTGRMILSLLFGSGYGTFLSDFTRFKSPVFNLQQNLWNLDFSFSSSYFFELLATTGLLGALSFIFIIIRVVKTRLYPVSPLFVAMIVSFILAFLIPYSFTLVFLLFVLLAFHASYLYLEDDKRVFNISISLIALRDGLFNVSEEGHQERASRRTNAVILPVLALLVIIAATGFVAFYSVRYVMADTKFATSLQQASLNNGQQTYDLQREAIDPTSLTSFPYKSDYYRVFSQVNLALANSVINNLPKGSSPSAQTQQTVVGLMQQSINSARIAASISPLTYTNWENLGGIYRSLIGVGQNAEQFAIASLTQAIALDPADPRLYIERGGIYYQLAQLAQQQNNTQLEGQLLDQAQSDFQLATQYKADYANAYYNLGHTLEMKGDYQNALLQYQIVQQLVKDNKQSSEQIKKEIQAVQAKASNPNSTNNQAQAGTQTQANGQNQLQVNEPSPTFPPQQNQVKLPPPPQSTDLPNKPASGSAK